MAEEDNEEQRSDEQEPTSVDWSSSPGEQSRPTDEEDSSPAGADERRNALRLLPHPSDEPDADGVPADDDSSPPAESDAEADEPDGAEVMVELPAGGGLPTSLLLAVLAAAVVLFLVALFACVHVWSGAAEEASALATGLTPADEGEEQPLPSAELLAGLTYSELTESARHCVTGADYERAAVLYAAAAEREEEGLPKALLARYKLAGALTLGARYGEAIHVVESLQAVSRPGDELWKNAVIAAIRIHQARKSRADFDRGLHLLRANSHRYGDEQALNRWLAYVEAMAGVEDVLARSEDSRSVYGVEPPPFGRAPYQGRPLAAEEIVPVSGKYGDGSLQVSCRLGEVRLRAEAAPLRDTLDAVADAAGIQIECDVPAQYVVVADIEGVTPQQCLETVLGSVGLALEGEGDRFVARSPQPRVESARQALESALWGLQEFLILCPDSPQLPEAYYALGHLHMTQGQRQMALDQLGVLTREFPLSSWTVYARYVQGRASCDQQDWQRGEQELLFVADSCSDASLARSAFLWAAHCQRSGESTAGPSRASAGRWAARSTGLWTQAFSTTSPSAWRSPARRRSRRSSATWNSARDSPTRSTPARPTTGSRAWCSKPATTGRRHPATKSTWSAGPPTTSAGAGHVPICCSATSAHATTRGPSSWRGDAAVIRDGDGLLRSPAPDR